MSDFDKAFETLMKVEGGYAPKDAGSAGSVNFGLTEKWVRENLPGHQDATTFVRELTREAAKVIYAEAFWRRYHCDEIDDQALAETHLLAVVNCPGAAPKILQRAVNEQIREEWPGGPLQPVKVDGAVGLKTLAATAQLDPIWLRKRYQRGLWEDHYAPLAQKPDYAPYRKAWLSRLRATGECPELPHI